MARQVNTTLTRSSVAVHIKQLDKVVSRLIATIKNLEDNEVVILAGLDAEDAEDAMYIADFNTAVSLAARFKAVLIDVDAQDEMLPEHIERIAELAEPEE